MKEQILLLTHGGWGKSLLKGVEMILGKIDFVDEIPLCAQDTQMEFENKVEAYLDDCQKNAPDQVHITIFTDLFGGTTTNTAACIARRRQNSVDVVTGLNAPLLLEACSQIAFQSSLGIPKLLEAAEHSIFDVMEKIQMKGVV